MRNQLVLVEDDPIFTFLLEKTIRTSHIEGSITAFPNGLKAMDFLEKEYQKDTNYIIFLDLNMPVMNGWQFMEAFNSVAEPSNCMVFIVTSSKNQRDIDILMGNPLVADFITKPITNDIIAKVKEMIAKRFEK